MDEGRLRTILGSAMDTGSIAGAALRFRRHDEIEEAVELGFGDLERRRPVTADSLFRLASLTKPAVAVAVLQLVEAGDLHLDDPVARFLPAFAATSVADGVPAGWTSTEPVPSSPRVVTASRPITVRDLLTHSSGLGQGPYSHPLIRALSRDDQTLAERVDAYATVPGDAQPGALAGYSPQVGFDILGRIVELVSGADLDSALRERLFGPLGMPDTAFVLSAAQRARLVFLAGAGPDGLRDDSDSDDARAMETTPAGLHSGAAGLFSTVADYDRFARMLHGGGELDGVRVLRPQTVAMLANERGAGARLAGPAREWGLGVIVATHDDDIRAAGAWGWSGAWGGHLVIDPANDTTLVVMVNHSDSGGADSALSRELERAAVSRR